MKYHVIRGVGEEEWKVEDEQARACYASFSSPRAEGVAEFLQHKDTPAREGVQAWITCNANNPEDWKISPIPHPKEQ